MSFQTGHGLISSPSMLTLKFILFQLRYYRGREDVELGNLSGADYPHHEEGSLEGAVALQKASWLTRGAKAAKAASDFGACPSSTKVMSLLFRR